MQFDALSAARRSRQAAGISLYRLGTAVRAEFSADHFPAVRTEPIPLRSVLSLPHYRFAALHAEFCRAGIVFAAAGADVCASLLRRLRLLNSRFGLSRARHLLRHLLAHRHRRAHGRETVAVLGKDGVLRSATPMPMSLNSLSSSAHICFASRRLLACRDTRALSPTFCRPSKTASATIPLSSPIIRSEMSDRL